MKNINKTLKIIPKEQCISKKRKSNVITSKLSSVNTSKNITISA